MFDQLTTKMLGRSSELNPGLTQQERDQYFQDALVRLKMAKQQAHLRHLRTVRETTSDGN